MANDPKLGEEVEKLKGSTREVTGQFEEQLRIMSEMRDVMSQIVKNMQALCAQDCAGMSPDKWNEVTKAVENNEKALKGTTTASQKMGKVVENLSNTTEKKWAKAMMVASVALDALGQGMKNFAALTQSAFNVATGIVGALWDVGKAIISIPFKMLEGLFKMAQTPGDTSLAQAIENTRKEFGDLKSESSKTVLDVAKNMGKLDNTGVSAYRIFGNLAERTEAVLKLTQSLGAAYQVFGKEIAANGEAIMRYNKGLGLTDEMMSSIASNAMRMGSGIADIQNDMAKQALGMSKAFGINAKVISRDMGKAMQDLAHFGHLSTKEIAVAATFANKLGVSVDKLTGILDATKTFDQTAEGMSKLNEQFGMNIDATALMMEQNPGKQVEMLRKEFARAGLDISKLSRHERELIKQNSGMTDEMLNSAFAAKNAGVSYDKISKQADNNAAKTMTQTQAMQKLASSMERIVKAGETAAGFFDALIKGFNRGIQSSPEFVKLITNIKEVLSETIMFGLKLGKMFFNLFPGVKQIITGLRDLFDPSKFRKFFNGIEKLFEDFGAGRISSFDKLMDALKDKFFNFFKQGAPQGQQILDGFAKFGQALVVVFSKLGSWVVDKLIVAAQEITKFLPTMFEALKDPNKMLPAANVPAWAKPLIELFNKIKDQLLPELGKMFSALWTGLEPIVMPALKKFIAGMLLVSFAPAVIGSVLSSLLGSLASAAGGAVKKFFIGSDANKTMAALEKGNAEYFAKWSKSFATDAERMSTLAEKNGSTLGKKWAERSAANAEKYAKLSADAAEKAAQLSETGYTKAAAKFSKFAESGFGKILGKVAVVAAIATAAVDVSDAIHKFSGDLEKKGFDPATAKIAAGTTGIINTLTMGLLPESWQGEIANALASGIKAFTGMLDKFFGPSLSKSIKEYLSSVFQVFGGLGDLISGVWNGDSKKVDKALKDIGEGILKMLVWSFESMFVEMPKLAMQLIVYLYQGFWKATAWLQHKLADLFHALENIPIIGPLFGLMGDLFDKLGNISDSIANLFGKLQNFLKSIDIAGYFKKSWASLKEFFTSGSKEGESFFSKIFGWFKDLSAIIEEPYRLLRKVFNIIFSWDTKKTFMENIKEKWDAVLNSIEQSGNKIGKLAEKLLEPFKTMWAWFKDVFSKITEFVSDTFTKAVDGIKRIFSWEGIKSIIENVVHSVKESLNKIADGGPFKMLIKLAEKVFDMHSPSKVFLKIGDRIVEGFEIGIDDLSDTAKAQFNQVVKDGDKMGKKLSSFQPTYAPPPGAPPGASPQVPAVSPENVEVAAKIIKMITDLVSAIGSAIGGTQAADISKINNATVTQIAAAVPTIMRLIDGIKDHVGPLIGQITDIVKKIPSDKGFKKSLDMAGKIFEFLGHLPELSGKLRSNAGNAAGSSFGQEQAIMDSVWAISGIVRRLTADWAQNPIQLITSGISLIGDAMPKDKKKLLKTMSDFTKLMTSLSGIFTKFDEIGKVSQGDSVMSTVWSIVNNLRRLTSDGTSQGIANPLARIFEGLEAIGNTAKSDMLTNAGTAVKGVSAAIKLVQQLDTALSKMDKINLETRLGEVIGQTGLGSSGAYTVKSKEIVLNVEFNVTMDAGVVEKAIITRSTSIIRDRINLALENINTGKDVNQIGIKKTGLQNPLMAATAQP